MPCCCSKRNEATVFVHAEMRPTQLGCDDHWPSSCLSRSHSNSRRHPAVFSATLMVPWPGKDRIVMAHDACALTRTNFPGQQGQRSALLIYQDQVWLAVSAVISWKTYKTSEAVMGNWGIKFVGPRRGSAGFAVFNSDVAIHDRLDVLASVRRVSYQAWCICLHCLGIRFPISLLVPEIRRRQVN
jgi:hypothetical protein